MLSLRQQATTSTTTLTETPSTTGNAGALQPSVLQFANLQDSLESFVTIVANEIKSSNAQPIIKLCCALPSYEEWSAGTNLDMHDLYDLHATLIRFLRSAVQRLRALKIAATYHLSPCQASSSVVLIRALKPSISSSTASSASCLDGEGWADEVRKEDRSKVYVGIVGGVPSLVTS